VPVTPRLAFVGVGWIGRDRMLAVSRSGVAEVACVADASGEAAAAAAAEVDAPVVEVDTVLAGAVDVDGVVIATPSALHAAQAKRALAAGLAVSCQKPLGRDAAECEAVIEAARRADRLLGVDLSYRHLAAVGAMREVIGGGGIGEVYAAELVFHNAYGPDRPWFTDRQLAGGGCVIDLGIHLVDLAHWLLDRRPVLGVTSRLFAGGRPLEEDAQRVEDHAVARLDLEGGGVVSLACSWFLAAGCDAVIGATFYGTDGAVALRNVDGSFYDFRAERWRGTKREVLVEPPDAWGGRAVVAWAEQLAGGAGFDPAVEDAAAVAAVLDRIYGR
jgi:predicted dehydrogenase